MPRPLGNNARAVKIDAGLAGGSFHSSLFTLLLKFSPAVGFLPSAGEVSLEFYRRMLMVGQVVRLTAGHSGVLIPVAEQEEGPGHREQDGQHQESVSLPRLVEAYTSYRAMQRSTNRARPTPRLMTATTITLPNADSAA